MEAKLILYKNKKKKKENKGHDAKLLFNNFNLYCRVNFRLPSSETPYKTGYIVRLSNTTLIT